jgi:ParB family transcriptional regulator, chromosome partitioning protein
MANDTNAKRPPAKIPSRGLGRGLSALLGPDLSAAPIEPNAGSADGLKYLSVAAMQAGQYQPRTRMDEGALQELAASIKQHGIMQPIVVRSINPNQYEIIAGERRFRAAKIAGLDQVPVIVKQVSNQDALALALIENIQREDLNPLEEAQAIKRLIDEFAFTHEQAAHAIGRSRSATSNLLRLLNLAAPVQSMLMAGDLEMGHARALLPLSAIDQITCANQIHQKALTVREAERLVANQLTGEIKATATVKTVAAVSRDVQRLSERLSDRLATTAVLKTNAKGKGQMLISFASHEGFEALLQKMGLHDLLDET